MFPILAGKHMSLHTVPQCHRKQLIAVYFSRWCEVLCICQQHRVFSPCRAASGHHCGGQRDRRPRLPRRPHLPRRQHGRLQPHLAERGSRRPAGPAGARPGQPLAAGDPRHPRSRRLVRVCRHQRGRGDSGTDLPDCPRWGMFMK